ncbi:hexosaminidase [Saccharicrinis carchari]|uniref:beta-N-acetylhexosaminidase n=2 Tax=Saccharicrinis carchari TaxID=1168039 RepID=A0A521EQ03_SACCC|nr:hexosaminidase [Saccharicrinis carchari]
MAVAFSCTPTGNHSPIHLIPEPLSINTDSQGDFMLAVNTAIVISDSTMLPAAEHLKEILKTELPIKWDTEVEKIKPSIVMRYDIALDSLSPEGYILDINKKNISISSGGPSGLFYAAESIRQLLPAHSETGSSVVSVIPGVKITDAPRFAWRGLHLDVSRHFMPLDFIKKYIDYMAMHKLNVFHWHLTDGIGWRIEIKSHPELTDIGAWRKVKEGKRPWQDFEVWRKGDTEPKYGGFYTQEEIREVVAYAQDRFITVLPEIELPGHSEVVMQCFPELLCTNTQGQALKNTGVYCAANPKSYQLLEDVIDEVLELFPSEYIHIGGDEVAKDNWNSCAKCGKMMRANNYDAQQLQSHFVNHFDNYLKNKGRKLMGWHEILEGELSPSASIMYWGGHDGTADALRENHPTVLTQGSHLYFDHYQSLSAQEPKAFGGFAPLKKVYELEPVPEELEPQYTQNVLGVQANLWTEYMPTPQRIEYMLFPRIAALAEIAWSGKSQKSWPHFRNKMNSMLKRYDAMGLNYATSALRPEIRFELQQDSRQLKVTLNTELHTDIYYTTDGSEPNLTTATLYTEPFYLDKAVTVKAIGIKDGKATGKPEIREARLHKAIGCEIELHSTPNERYAAQGGSTLVNADFGGNKWGNGKWLGFLNKDFEATITFEQATTIEKVALSCIEETGSGIYLPKGMEIQVSIDGKNFETAGTWSSERKGDIAITPEVINEEITVSFNPIQCKYLRIKAPYHQIKDQGVFMFIDEIIVQ